MRPRAIRESPLRAYDRVNNNLPHIQEVRNYYAFCI